MFNKGNQKKFKFSLIPVADMNFLDREQSNGLSRTVLLLMSFFAIIASFYFDKAILAYLFRQCRRYIVLFVNFLWTTPSIPP